MTEREQAVWLARVQGYVGGPAAARDAVNQAMIRHWCDALGDRNPRCTRTRPSRGEARDFVNAGGLDRTGQLPNNTSGATHTIEISPGETKRK
jgi:hypothetical protein